MPSLTVTVAKKLLPNIRQQTDEIYEEYAEVEQKYLREGFIPEYCIHGVNQWTDYDINCSHCELYGHNKLPNPLELALTKARKRVADYEGLLHAAYLAKVHGATEDICTELSAAAVKQLRSI